VAQVDLELAPDGIADAALESAQRFLLRLPLGDLALVVGPAGGVVADLGDGGQVKRVVELAVAAWVEPVTTAGPAGGFDGGGANRAGVGNRAGSPA
jgi:hypothetical protein